MVLDNWLQRLLGQKDIKDIETKADDRSWVGIPVTSSTSPHGKTLQVDFPSITKWAYRGNELVHACIDERGRAYKEGRLKMYKESDETIVKNHPIEVLMRQPNPFRSQGDMLETIEQHLSLAGNAFIRKIRDKTGQVRELWIMQPHLVKINPHPLKYIESYTYTVDGNEYVLDPKDVMHLLYIDPEDDYYGLSPLVAAAKRIDTDTELGRFLKQVLLNMAVTSGCFVTEKKLNKTDRQILEGAIASRYIGSIRAGLPMLLGGGMKWQQTSMNLKDLEVGNIQSILETRICMSLHVPAILVGAKAGLERSTFSNAKEARDYMYENAISPEWTMTAEKIGLSLLRDFGDEDSGLVPRFDTSHIKALQESEDARYKRMKGADYLSDIEKRLYTGHDKEPEGVIFKNVSMIPVDISKQPVPKDVVEEPEPGKPNKLVKDPPTLDKKKKNNEEIKARPLKETDELKVRMGSLFDEHMIMFEAAAKQAFEDTKGECLVFFDRNFTGEKLDWEPLTSRLEATTKRSFQTNIFQLYKEGADIMAKFIEERAVPTTKTSIPDRAAKYARQQAGDLAKELTKTSKKQIKKIVSEGVKAGDTADIIRGRLAEQMTDWTANRAELVAETETVRAANAGILDSIKEKGHGFKKWITLPGACKKCIPFEGQIFHVDDLFGDITLAPPLHPRCRCILVDSKKPKERTLYRGGDEGQYYSTSEDFARNFTQSGLDSEIEKITLPENQIFRNPDGLPFAGDVAEMDAVMAEARKKGYTAIWVDEGIGQPNSVFMLNNAAYRQNLETATNAFNALKERYPMMKNTKLLEKIPVDTRTGIEYNDAYAQAYPDKGEIYLNPNWLGDDQLSRTLREQFDNGFSTGKDIGDMLAHETGHVIHAELEKQEGMAWGGRINKGFSWNRADVLPSKYAVTDDFEAFAESFTQYNRNLDLPWGNTVGDMLNAYKEKTGVSLDSRLKPLAPPHMDKSKWVNGLPPWNKW